VLAQALRKAGIDAVTPWDCGLDGHEDVELAEFALREHRWIATNDEDFIVLALDGLRTGTAFPSVIYWEQQPQRRIGWLVSEIGTILGAATDADDVGQLIFM
jgi:hypothetical protein